MGEMNQVKGCWGKRKKGTSVLQDTGKKGHLCFQWNFSASQGLGVQLDPTKKGWEFDEKRKGFLKSTDHFLK